jgi:hypothetical protein
MRIRLPLLAALPLATAAGLALAAASFATLDTNKDGYVSKAEAQKDTSIDAGFAAADKNKDGKLDRAEFAAAANGTTGAPMRTRAPEPTRSPK